MKRLWKGFAVSISGIIVVTAAFIYTGRAGYNANFAVATMEEAVATRGLALTEEDGYPTFTMNGDGNFKILQLSDLHIGGGMFSAGQDKKAIAAITSLVGYANPDFIIITGDMVYAVPFQSGTINNLRSTMLVCGLFSGLGIPWAVVLGNHDTDSYATENAERIARCYASAGGSLFCVGPSDIGGYGNYVVNVDNEDGTINTSLFFFDSNIYGRPSKKKEHITSGQVAWYETQIAELSASAGKLISSLAFMHIPLYEYQTAWDLYLAGSSEVTYFFGGAGEKNGRAVKGGDDNNLFETMVRLGSTKGVFCGHRHLNNFSVEYDGIRLTFARPIDYIAYFEAKKASYPRGATIITINSDSSFDVEQVALADVA